MRATESSVTGCRIALGCVELGALVIAQNREKQSRIGGSNLGVAELRV